MEEYEFENAVGIQAGSARNLATGRPGTVVVGQPIGQATKQDNNFVIKVDTGTTTNTQSHVVQLFGSGFNVSDVVQPEVDSTLWPGRATRNNEVRNSAGTGIAQLYSMGRILVDGGVATANSVYFDQLGRQIYNYNVGSTDNIFVTITQGALSYLSLLEWLRTNQIHLNKIRMTHNNSLTLGLGLTMIQKTIWGSSSTKIITGTLFPNPINNQPLIYDAKVDINLNSMTSMNFTLAAGAGVGVEFTMQSDYSTAPVI